MIIDTHAHLYWDSFKNDLDEVIKRATYAGVTTVINVGVDVKLSQTAAEQTEKVLNKLSIKAYSTIGIHPHEAIKYHSDESIHKDISELEKIYQTQPDQPFDFTQGKIIAVGECGLDYLLQEEYLKLPDGTTLSIDQVKNMQRKLFQAQIDLAKKLNLPLLVHCRDDRSKGSGSTSSPPQETTSPSAWDEVLKMVGNHPAILHCYSGLPPTTNYLLTTNNYLISFAANITYPKNEYLREAAKILPLEQICLETDSPFLSPQSKRGQRNEPSNTLEIAQLIAELKGVSLETVAQTTTSNVKTMFRIS